MNIETKKFHKPAKWENPKGSERLVGFEIEFAGVDIDKCTEIIVSLFGGDVSFDHALHAVVKNTQHGDFTVELDSRLLRDISKEVEYTKENKNSTLNLYPLLKEVNQWAGAIFKTVVPLEIVTSPLKFEAFSDLETLCSTLRKNHAEGTKSSFIHAFGLHINPELPSHDVEVIIDYLRAFFILYPWLLKALDTETTRRLLTFISPFPKEYILILLQKDYTPSIDTFIDDYLTYSPTRNRALDLLPLLEYLQPGVKTRLPEKEQTLLKKRPTFHYRLPNCEINDENWTIAKEWNSWVLVEDLASNKEALNHLSEKYHHFLKRPVKNMLDNWGEILDREYFDPLSNS